MPSASRSAYLLTVLAAVACAGAPAPKSVNGTALRAGIDSASNRLLAALRTNASDSLLVLMAENVVLMPPHEPVLKGKAAVQIGRAHV